MNDYILNREYSFFPTPPQTPPHRGEGLRAAFRAGFPSPLWGGARGGGLKAIQSNRIMV